jgi:hypothetical protein
MKALKTQFICNVDGFKNQQFTQIKRINNVAIYERKDLTTGKLVGYEVFDIKIVPEGFQFTPTSTPVAEAYEFQPGKSAFGKSAWFCTTLERAEIRFSEFLSKQSGTPIQKVRIPVQSVKITPVDTSGIKFPDGTFTRKTFLELNGIDYNTVAVVIRQLIDENKLEIVGTQ